MLTFDLTKRRKKSQALEKIFRETRMKTTKTTHFGIPGDFFKKITPRATEFHIESHSMGQEPMLRSVQTKTNFSLNLSRINLKVVPDKKERIACHDDEIR